MNTKLVKFRSDGWVLVKADFVNQKLSVRSSVSCETACVRLVAFDSAFAFHIMLRAKDDAIELLPVTTADYRLLL